MAIFQFQGYDTKGKKTSGVVDAESARAARVKLKTEGVLATNVEEAGKRRELLANPLATLSNRIGSKEITFFTRRLATLQSGGLTIVESLDALIEQANNPRLKSVITDIREKVIQGVSLADALAAHEKHFDLLYVNLVKAGETAGDLSNTLNRLAAFHESQLIQRSKLIVAMVYPLIMTVIGSAVLLFLLTYVVPQVETMFEDMRVALPMTTVILLATSRFVTEWWILLVVVSLVSIIWIVRWRKTVKGRRALDSLILKIPLLGELIRNAAISRFAKTLAIQLSGGAPLISSLKVTSNVVDNVLLTEAVEQAIVNITEGHTIADPLKASGLFPPLVTQMIAAGERSGSLTDMLERISEAYDFEVEASSQGLMAALGPALIIAMGGVVMFIVLSILLPIFEISNLV